MRRSWQQFRLIALAFGLKGSSSSRGGAAAAAVKPSPSCSSPLAAVAVAVAVRAKWYHMSTMELSSLSLSASRVHLHALEYTGTLVIPCKHIKQLGSASELRLVLSHSHIPLLSFLFKQLLLPLLAAWLHLMINRRKGKKPKRECEFRMAPVGFTRVYIQFAMLVDRALRRGGREATGGCCLGR